MRQLCIGLMALIVIVICIGTTGLMIEAGYKYHRLLNQPQPPQPRCFWDNYKDQVAPK